MTLSAAVASLLLAPPLLAPALLAVQSLPGGGVERNRAPASRPADAIDTSQWVPDRQLVDVVPDGDRVYLLGGFTRIGPYTGPLARLDLATGSPLDGLEFDGTIRCIEADGAGGYWIGGEFETIDGVAHAHLAHVLANGTVVAWNPKINGIVYAIELSGSTIYLGGEFNAIGASTRNNLAAFDVNTLQLLAWAPVGSSSWQSGSRVLALEAVGNVVCIGGYFDELFAGVQRRHFAAANAVTGVVNGWNHRPDGTVTSLESIGTTLYIGGWFTDYKSTARARLAALDTSTNTLLPWAPAADRGPEALLAVGNDLYVGGSFTTLNGQYCGGGGALDGTTGATLGFTAALGGTTGGTTAIYALAWDGTHVCVGGHFTHVNGFPRLHFARIDPATGAMSPFTADAAGGEPTTIHALAASATQLALGGDLAVVGGEERHSLAAIDADSGRLLPFQPPLFADPNGPVWGGVHALLREGDDLWVGGSFRYVGNTERPLVAKLERRTGRLVPGFDAQISFNAGAVTSLAKTAEILFVGGNFSQSTRPDHFIALDDDGGWPWPGFACDSGPVLDLELDLARSMLFVTGTFTTFGTPAVPRNYVAAIEPQSGAVLPWDPQVNTNVYDIERHDAELFLGGAFQTVGGQTRRRFAAVASDDGTLLPLDLDVVGGGSDGVEALLETAGTLLIGGNFDTVTGAWRENLAAIDLASGTPLDWEPLPDATVRRLVTHRARLYVLGDFRAIAGRRRNGFAVFAMLPAAP